MPQKTCTGCNDPKPLTAFSRQREGKYGRHAMCKSCQNTRYARPFHRRNPIAKRVYKLRNRYGMTLEDFETRKVQQNNRCAICGKTPARFDIDHDPVSGKVRGLLCNQCNQALGLFKDQPELLRKAAEYLEKAKEDVQENSVN